MSFLPATGLQDVVLYHIRGYRADRSEELASRPEIPPPEDGPQLGEESEQMVTGLPLQELNHLGHRLCGWDLQEDVYVVRHHLQGVQSHSLLLGDALDQVSQTSNDILPGEGPAPVLRR